MRCSAGWLKEVFERGIEGVIFDDGATYQVATIPAIVLLKFIAWDDRPEYRLKDLQDIAVILDNYFHRFSDDIYDNHSDLFDNRELEEIAAYVIGRKIKSIIGDSADLKKRIIHILTDKQKAIAERLILKTEQGEADIVKVLQNLLDGILEK